MKFLYFDNCASYPIHPKILAMMQTTYEQLFANPSSMHGLGQKNWEALESSRTRIAQVTNTPSGGIYFSSGATESINILVQGYAQYLQSIQSTKNEILISSIEHLAVHNTVLALKQKGWAVKILPVDPQGRILPEMLFAALSPKTAMVVFIDVNNEIGTKQDIHALAKWVKQADPEIFFITDSAQAIGKTTVCYDTDLIDAFFVSGHKIGAPKNSGFFYLNPEFRILPITFGGGQESSYRPGTTDAVLATFLATALEEVNNDLVQNGTHVEKLNQMLTAFLDQHGILYQRVIPRELSSPYICSLTIPEIKGNALISLLSKRDIHISGGSACSSSCGTKSRVLHALQKSDADAVSTIRISFSVYNTPEEVEILAAAIHECILEVKNKGRKGVASAR